MKVKVICRSEEDFTRERNQDLQKVFRNLDPVLRPMAKAHEYKRALNAVKLDKIFAKPFVGAMDGHADGVSCMAKNPRQLNCLATGSMDGDIRLWDVAFRRTVQRFPGHERAVRGVAISSDGHRLLSCGDDCTVRLWQLPSFETGEASASSTSTAMAADRTEEDGIEPVAVFQGKNAFRAVDHRWQGRMFATAGVQVDVWEHNRSEPVQSFSWGADSVYSVKFNPSEPDIFATTGSDRSVALYDIRTNTPIRKLIMQTKTNAVAWNPRESFNFTTASEDCCCYSYDMRRLGTATCVHKDHVSSVMDLDYSPTGREFVTGSYDRSVRLFDYNGGHSKEVYHTKRMQRVFCVRFSGDGSYVFSGSDDFNVRIWKAKASQQMGVLLPREKSKASYMEAVKQRFKALPEIGRIDRHRHVPKAIFKADRLRKTMEGAERRKEGRRRQHSAPDTAPPPAARKRKIVTELE